MSQKTLKQVMCVLMLKKPAITGSAKLVPSPSFFHECKLSLVVYILQIKLSVLIFRFLISFLSMSFEIISLSLVFINNIIVQFLLFS